MRSASTEHLKFYPSISRARAEARSKLSFEVSDHLAQHLTLASDPKDLVSQVELDRKRKFHWLIQRYLPPTMRQTQADPPRGRYISQIQYGCKNPSCATPTCFSCRKRLASSPVRKYTPLSARTLACFLADARDPEAALCPHEPIHPVQPWGSSSEDKIDHLSSKQTYAVNRFAKSHIGQKHFDGKQPSVVQRNSNQAPVRGEEEIWRPQTPALAGWTPLKRLQRPARDPKSFTQALFDALPLRLLERMPPTPHHSCTQKRPLGSRQASYSTLLHPNVQAAYPEPTICCAGHNPDIAGSNQQVVYEGTTIPHVNGCATANGQPKEPTASRRPTPSFIYEAVGNDGFESSADSSSTSRVVRHEVPADQSSEEPPTTAKNSHVSEDCCGDLQRSSVLVHAGGGPFSVPTLTSLPTEVLKELDVLHQERRGEQSRLELLAFFRQSLYYCLKDPWRISASFESSQSSCADSRLPSSFAKENRPVRFNPTSVRTNLRSMSVLCPWREIVKNLSIATQSLYLPASLRRQPLQTPSLNDRQAARVCVIGLYALTELGRTDNSPPDTARAGHFNRIRPEERVGPFLEQPLGLCDMSDEFELLNLLERIVSVTANRWTLWEVSKAHSKMECGNDEEKLPNIIQSILDYMEDDANQMLTTWAFTKTDREKCAPYDVMPDIAGSGLLSMLALHWLRALMFREWDGRTSVRKSDTVGNVLQILAAMYERHQSIGLKPADFWSKMLVNRFDSFDVPMEWLAFRSDNKTVHLLSYSFLFPPETLVTYFRAINYSRMVKTAEGFILTKRAYNEFVGSGHSYQIQVPQREALEQRLGIVGLPRFVVEVRRDNVLIDAINQIWRRQKLELLKPLKVRIGNDEGEEGVDSGGVQQEFFRVLFAQALDPSYGMFSVDEDTRMTWLQPQSPEPPYKFEALGVLMSLAVYNSITLPITFPIAFYRKLLGLKVKKLAHIADGWPVLAKNLQSLLDWEDGDVGDIFLRTYEFSYEAFGTVVSVDMGFYQRDAPWPPQPTRTKTTSFDVPSEPDGDESAIPVPTSTSRAGETTAEAGYHEAALEASLVTNANREQYVKDYIFWLTDKSVRPQYEAFARGFYACLDRTALSIFTAEALRSFIEGVQEIDIDGLQASTVYDGYTADDEVVQWFWEVVKSWDHDKKKLLLEFITASDRVPVNGVSVIGLVIQCAGRSDEILPRSMTCFATFLLPLYSSKEVLEKMLGIAIEHAKGFGTI